MPLYTINQKTPLTDISAFIAPDARIIGDVHIGKQASVWFQSVIRGDFEAIRIGDQTNIQDLCMCHADEDVPLRIGNRVTIGHRCVMHGCTVADDVLVGMGAIVMNHAVIGKGSVIGAGSVVLEGTQVPEFSLVTGAPATVRKTYTDRNRILQRIGTAAAEYVKMSRNYTDTHCFHIASL